MGGDAGPPSIQGVVIHRWLGRLDLVDGHVPVDHALNAVADDDHHIPVITHIRCVAHPTVAGDNHRAALRHVIGSAHVDQLDESFDYTVDAAALVHVD